MRKAAGIMLIILGLYLISNLGVNVAQHQSLAPGLAGLFVIIICVVFIVIGGVCCLMRRYWELCFASPSVAIFIMILWLIGAPSSESLLTWFITAMGTLPIVFVYLGKRQWSESQG
jgi:hypothetical protein